MKYADLLKEYIKNSRLTLDEISEKLEEVGLTATKQYLSKLQNGKTPPASEKLNQAIAEITNGDPDKLNWYAYIEKAPEGFKNILYQLGEEIIPAGKKLLEEFPGFLEENYDTDKLLDSPTYLDFREIYSAALAKIRPGWPFTKEQSLEEEKYSARRSKLETILRSSKERPVYELFLEEANETLDEATQTHETIKSALISAFIAFELRVNGVILKAMILSGMDEETAIKDLNESSINGKLRTPMIYYLDFDLTNEPFYQDLMNVLQTVNHIVLAATSINIENDEARGMIKTIESAIKTINKHASEKGIE